MEFGTIVILLSCLAGVAAILALVALSAYSSQRKNRVRDLVHDVMTSSAIHNAPKRRQKLDSEGVEDLKRRTKTAQVKELSASGVPNLSGPNGKKALIDAKFFQAGLFTTQDREFYQKFQLVSPIFCGVFFLFILVSIGAPAMLTVSGLVLGLLIGMTLPKSWLERQVRHRQDATLYYLPLVIEQISIGVSSSLDLGPCIANILEMAKARNTHNPVTELFMYVEKLISSGMSLQEALEEVGIASGLQQIKHAFKFLAQCSEHGGEVSKQLQELANSVMQERQMHVEGKIASLPVKATGPLFLVFAGYFILMLSGIFARLMTAMTLN